MSAAGLRDVRQKLSKLKQHGVNHPLLLTYGRILQSASWLQWCTIYIDENWEELHEVQLGCNGFTGQ